jgi:hypothetical protein
MMITTINDSEMLRWKAITGACRRHMNKDRVTPTVAVEACLPSVAHQRQGC